MRLGVLEGGRGTFRDYGEALKGYQEALNNNGNALKGDGEALKGDGNTLLSHFNDFCCRPLCVFAGLLV